MAEAQYVVTSGIVQQFGDKPPYETREVNGSDVRDFTIKTLTTQSLVRISLWEEMADTEVGKGDFVAVDGKYTVSDDGKYHNISATSVAVLRGMTRAPKSGGSTRTAAGSDDAAATKTKAPF